MRHAAWTALGLGLTMLGSACGGTGGGPQDVAGFDTLVTDAPGNAEDSAHGTSDGETSDGETSHGETSDGETSDGETSGAGTPPTDVADSGAPAAESANAPLDTEDPMISSEITDDAGPDAPPEPEVATPPPACASYLQPEPRATLPDVLNEASGLVVSARDPGLLWTHNDSGGAAHLFALSATDGALVANLALPTVTPIDWEDLSNGPCAPGDGGRDCLYIGDFGDNQSARSSVTVHRLVEPEGPTGDLAVEAVESMVLQYPDGARDCESLVVDDDATLWLLTKEWGIGTFRVYTAPFAASAEPVTLTFVSEHDLLGIPGELLSILTGADYRPDLRPARLIVRLYQVALEYRLTEGGLHALADAERVVVPSGKDVQGESIAYGDGGYWHTSEGVGAPLWFVGCAD